MRLTLTSAAATAVMVALIGGTGNAADATLPAWVTAAAAAGAGAGANGNAPATFPVPVLTEPTSVFIPAVVPAAPLTVAPALTLPPPASLVFGAGTVTQQPPVPEVLPAPLEVRSATPASPAADSNPIPLLAKGTRPPVPNTLRTSTNGESSTTATTTTTQQPTTTISSSSGSSSSSGTAATIGTVPLFGASSSMADATSPPSLLRATKKPKTTTMTSLDGSDGSGSGGDYLANACACKDVRKVSLMSAADYCLPPSAVIGDKCGNEAVGERGECPRANAQPCQDTGHVLRNDSICAYDKRDSTYKCVASKEDLYEQKYGKKKKKKSSSNSTKGADSDTSMAAGQSTTRQVLVMAMTLFVSLVVVVA